MAIKKTTKKTAAKKSAAKNTTASADAKFNLVDSVIEGVLEIATVARDGSIKIKKTEMKKVLDASFEKGALAAAKGERVRFPIIGTLVRKDVEARKAGKGVNPFTGEEIKIQARPASKKPRWSFPKALKDIFAAKKNW